MVAQDTLYSMNCPGWVTAGRSQLSRSCPVSTARWGALALRLLKLTGARSATHLTFGHMRQPCIPGSTGARGGPSAAPALLPTRPLRLHVQHPPSGAEDWGPRVLQSPFQAGCFGQVQRRKGRARDSSPILQGALEGSLPEDLLMRWPDEGA